MLKLYTKNKCPSDKEFIQVPWDKFFKQHKITKYFDESDRQIVENVEQTSLINSETINGKFSDMPIGIGCLSEGCKTLLCINHAIKTGTVNQYIFNITSCGGNAVAYLAKEMTKTTDVYATIEHSDFGKATECEIEINGQQICTDTFSASSALVKAKNIGVE